MANVSSLFSSAVNVAVVQIVNADASGLKTVFTAGANGSKVTGLFAASDDSSARIVEIGITRSGTFYALGAITVAITAGTDGSTAAVNMLDVTKIPGLPIDNDSQRYIFLKSGDTLQAKSLSTVTSAKTIHLVATGVDF